MSERQAGGAGRGGGGRGRDGRGRGRGGRGGGVRKIKKKYTSNTPELKDDIFECGKAEHVALFEKSQKALVNYIRMRGDKESAIVASIIEDMTTRGIPVPPRPAQIENPVQPNPRPDPPEMIDDEAGIYIWQGELKMIASRRVSLAQGLIQAYATIWDQCSKTTKGKLEQLPAFQQINADKDPVRLLEEIRNIICGRESHRPPIYTMVQLIKMLCTFFQHADTSNEDYKEQFESL